jgi:hypothetical protein
VKMNKSTTSSINLSPDQVRWLRMKGQYLRQPAGPRDLVEVVNSVCGINAQLLPAMMLALRTRIQNLTPSVINKAITQKQLVRTWVMRGTIHLIDANDIHWLVSLLGPKFIAMNKGRRAELGLNEDILAKELREIPKILDSAGPLSREELVDKLIEKGLPIDRKSQAPAHLIQYAALKGLICFGPFLDNGKSTFVLTDKWVGRKNLFPRESGLVRLVEHYLKGYGPASIADFAAWSGLSLTDAREGWGLHAPNSH